MARSNTATLDEGISFEELKEEILGDFRLINISREASFLGRKEVLSGKAKFGIFGDGKELAQVAMAKQFRHGDWRSGYYRDMTFMFAIGELTVQQWFAQLYANPSLEADPSSAGRQMNSHFATRSLNEDGSWKALSQQYNSSPDISPTAGQMPRLLGLAQASKVFRNNKDLHDRNDLTTKGNEVAFGTIGDASTSEGLFWETVNAAGVLQVPMAISVWDDGWGISVPKKYQTTKESISELMKGFEKQKDTNGYYLYNTKAWDYVGLNRVYEEAISRTREEHVPCLIHVDEVTQPQGHSTSGSHERYKSEALLQWYKDFDCIQKFKEWIIKYRFEGKKLATSEELEAIQKEAKKTVREKQKAAWADFTGSLKSELDTAQVALDALAQEEPSIALIADELRNTMDPQRKEIDSCVRRALLATAGHDGAARNAMKEWLNASQVQNHDRFNSRLYSDSEWSSLNISEVPAEYGNGDDLVDARLIIRDNFKELFKREPLLLTFGEDTGKIGDVNQGMEGMQKEFGELRVSDTGIREATIVGQGIGMALRGLRPIAEIQYLDYLLYSLQIMSDDLSTIQYRTKGGQKAPLIIRTRGHRLEGIWHAGSPMGTIIHAIRGIVICVPRNMTQAAGMYNTLIQSDDPALVIEPLNGYRLKERMPNNLAEFTTPMGVPEIVRTGTDLTVVSYGSTFKLCEKAAERLAELGIDIELIDVRTLLPFDRNHMIASSIAKTNRVLIVDEDVPGGASAYILQQVMQEQKAYYHLDSAPTCLSAKPHRPAYGTDGDHFSKPGIEDIVEKAYGIMSEFDPQRFPLH